MQYLVTSSHVFNLRVAQPFTKNQLCLGQFRKAPTVPNPDHGFDTEPDT